MIKNLSEVKKTKRAKIINLLKLVHTHQVSNTPLNHLAQWQIHLEDLAPGNTTEGSYLHGDDPEICVEVLSDMLKTKVKQEVAYADAVGIQIDESTDISKCEIFAIVGKLVSRGQINTRLLAVYHVEDLTAKGLFAKIEETIKEYEIPTHKWECINTDGASVMTGRLNALNALIKDKYPNVKHIHCLAHRLNLAVREALWGTKSCIGISEYRRLESSFKQLRKFLKSSSKSQGALDKMHKVFNDARKKTTALHDIRQLSLHEATDSFLGQLYTILQCLIQISEDKSTKKKRASKASGLYRYFTRFSTLALLCLVCDITEETNILRKVMQRSKVNAHDILEGIERTQDFFHEIEIAEIGSRIEFVGLKRLKIPIDNRILSESGSPGRQKLFLIPDQENREKALGSFPKSKKPKAKSSQDESSNSEGDDISFDLKIDLASDEDDTSFDEREENGVHFPLQRADHVHCSDKIKLTFKPTDFNSLVVLAEKIKQRLGSVLVKRFPQDTREQLSLSVVFDPSRQPKEAELFEQEQQDIISGKLVKLYASRLKINPILLTAQLKKLHRNMKPFHTEDSFENHVSSQVENNPHQCEEVLSIRNKLRALSQSTADTERMFSLMNRIKGKLSSRIGKSLDHRMRVQAHLPKNPAFIDWNHAFDIWKEKKKKYVEMKVSNKFLILKELKGKQISLLNM